MEQSESAKSRRIDGLHPIYDLFPVTFPVALLLGVARVLVGSRGGQPRTAIGEQWSEIMAEALITAGIGVLAMSLASRGRAKTSGPSRGDRLMTAMGFVLATGLAAAFLADWKGDFQGGGSASTVIGCATGASLMSLGLIGAGLRGRLATVLLGPLCLGVAYAAATAFAAT